MTTSKAKLVEAVPAAQANRRFSELLRGVREGKSYVVTSHGRPVARLSPPDLDAEAAAAARAAAWEALRTRLRTNTGVEIAPWTRDELYERGKDD